jgi:hypothetical protein
LRLRTDSALSSVLGLGEVGLELIGELLRLPGREESRGVRADLGVLLEEDGPDWGNQIGFRDGETGIEMRAWIAWVKGAARGTGDKGDNARTTRIVHPRRLEGVRIF